MVRAWFEESNLRSFWRLGARFKFGGGDSFGGILEAGALRERLCFGGRRAW
jgi:hypothetical protein